MDVDFKKLIEGIGEFASAYLQNFVGILISPNKTFETLLTSNSPDKFAIPQRRTIDTAAIRFAAISVVIGLLMASSFLLKGNIGASGTIISQTVVTQIFLWLIYAIIIHFTATVILGGRGKIEQTISSMLYVLGVLHPLLILATYLISVIYPDILSYDLTLRRLGGYVGTLEIIKEHSAGRVNVLSLGIVGLYWFVSFSLTMYYLYFPLKIVHNLSKKRILLLFSPGILFVVYYFHFFIVRFLFIKLGILELYVLFIVAVFFLSVLFFVPFGIYRLIKFFVKKPS